MVLAGGSAPVGERASTTTNARAPLPLRVLHCPEAVAGIAYQLARAEREVGAQSISVAMQPHPFGYAADEFLCGNSTGKAKRFLAKLRLLRRAMSEFDVVHFNFGQSLFSHDAFFREPASRRAPVRALHRVATAVARKALAFRDLKMLRRAGKAIVVTFQGDDARQGDYARAHFPITWANEVDASYYTAETDRIKRVRIAEIARYADRIYSLNPDLLYVLPASARFLPYPQVDLRDWRPTWADVGSDRPLRVVHAPSHRAVKGTRYILDAVERLRHDGYRFDFQLIEGLPRDEARRTYERADVLIDQLLAGWYGGLAVEMMALGKPVICNMRWPDMRFLPPEMAASIPIIDAAPTSIYSVLKDVLTERRQDLTEIGRRGRCFVERWHDPTVIARGLVDDYREILSRGRTL